MLLSASVLFHFIDLEKDFICSIQCGASHSMAISKRMGKVYTWGKNSQGQCGRGKKDHGQALILNDLLSIKAIRKMYIVQL
jgi:alpha-tubulin suppressor-like RCC1 family protein